MKISSIKKTVESFNLQQLQQAEEALMNEQSAAIDIEGEDEGEQLTHVLAAIWIRTEMDKAQSDFTTALRLYTTKVRSSIN